MSIKKLKWLLVIPAFFIIDLSVAQDSKREKEVRIPEEMMPGNAMEILRPFLGKARKIRFYHETDGTRHSYECKFIHERKNYSIEFSEEGLLEDVEVLISERELPGKAASGIEGYLTREYSRYIIRRIQKQFTSEHQENNPGNTIKYAFEDEEKDMIIRYELEVDGTREGDLVSHEILFDDEGEFLQKRSIIRRQVDNILY